MADLCNYPLESDRFFFRWHVAFSSLPLKFLRWDQDDYIYHKGATQYLAKVLHRCVDFEYVPGYIKSVSIYSVSVTVVSGLIMLILFVSELNYYISKEVHQELFVDTSKGQKLQINVDITFLKIGCSCKYIYIKLGIYLLTRCNIKNNALQFFTEVIPLW